MDTDVWDRPATAARIPFADGTDKDIPASWAETMIRGLYRDNPRLFGKLVLEAIEAGRVNGQR